MWTMMLTVVLGAEPPAHAPTERVLVDTLKAAGRSAPLVLGPCSDTRCALFVEGTGGKATVATFGAGPYQVVDVDHGWLVHGEGAGDAFSFAWEPFPGLAPEATVLVHTERGQDHIVDHWTLVTLGDAPMVLWEGGAMPRDVGPSDVRAWAMGEATYLVFTEVVGRETLGGPHDNVRIAVVRHEATKGELVAVPEAEWPLYAVVYGSFPTPDEAEAAVGTAPCLRATWRLDSGVYPKLSPDLTVLGRVTPDRALADRWLQAARACRSDAYVKRAR